MEIRELSEPEEFTQYVDVINDSRKRAGIPPYSSSDILGVSQYLHPRGYYTVFGAFEGSRLLAGLGVSYFNGYLHEWGAGTSSEAIQRKIYASDAIKWHIIEWASAQGHRFFDLSGVSPKPFDQQAKKEQGIFRFKAKWGGGLVKYREYSLPISRKRDKLLSFGKKLIRSG
ncbi:GNAT family N-acetyltransferase [Candidatus Micrarchaeota archaeon]|nr:GNAT family N-acetyltransferase [Candidatus Micrarchaeota archaeon]